MDIKFSAGFWKQLEKAPPQVREKLNEIVSIMQGVAKKVEESGLEGEAARNMFESEMLRATDGKFRRVEPDDPLMEKIEEASMDIEDETIH